jgi:hypothetical protein
MSLFKVGDRVRVKQLSKEEFENVYYIKNVYTYYNYERYLNHYSNYFNKTYIVKDLSVIDDNIITLDTDNDSFFSDELIKAYSLRDKLNLIKELIK